MADDQTFTFSENAIRQIVERMFAEKRQSLMRSLSSVRRHEGVMMPEEPVRFHNASGEIIPAYGVMRVTSLTIADGDLLEVNKPNSTFYCRYLVNNGDSVAINANGEGTWLEKSGPVLYNSSSGTPVIDEEWGVKDAQWSLEKNRPGFIITGSTSTGDVYKSRAKQHVVTALKGKADSGISKGSTGTVSIYMGASGSEADTSINITCRALGAAITSAKWVVVWFESGVWYVGPWECS